MPLKTKLRHALNRKKHHDNDDHPRRPPFGYTPPYPPDRPIDEPSDPWKQNSYDRRGIPQPSHPLWGRFWNDTEARPYDPGESFLKTTLDQERPLESDGLSQGERAILQMKEDKEYEELIQICKASRAHNDEINERGRYWHAATLAEPSKQDEQAEREARDKNLRRRTLALLMAPAL
ncbi:MAG: hypothetical protein Q9182_003095 [Xanthomendoza sp. 2 TL-2023]